MASASESKWQISKDTLLERNKYMFNNSLMSDVKFAFPNKQTIPAHKYVLAISSPVFFTMFYGSLAEQGETVDITDCDPDVFLQFLRYLYCDDAIFQDVNNAIQVWHLADKYDLPSLARECVNFIEATMEPSNAFDVIPYARRFNHEGLENVCWEIIDFKAQVIVGLDSFKDLKQEYLLPFLQRSSLRVKEASLFKAMDRWAVKRCEESNMTVDGANKRSVLGEDLLKLIRFSLMSPEEFSEVVLPTDILLTAEVIDVFKHFTSVSIPGGFKFSVLPRARPLEQIQDLALLSLGSVVCLSESLFYYERHVRESMQKTGVLSFMVRDTLALCAVKILIDSQQSSSECCVSVFRGDKKISQIKKEFVVERGSAKRGRRASLKEYGEIDVFFNRPVSLSKNTCYTIQTKTDTSLSKNNFIWSDSCQTSRASDYFDQPLSCCSGHYTESIPTFVHYKGEVMALLGKLEQKTD